MKMLLELAWRRFNKRQESLGERCIDYEAEGVTPRWRLKKTFSEVAKKMVRSNKCARRMIWPSQMEKFRHHIIPLEIRSGVS